MTEKRSTPVTDRLPATCDRCLARLGVSVMSKFNRDVVCFACKQDELAAPGYAAAAAAEEAAVRRGDYDFLGVGLSAEDHVFLAARRAARPRPGELPGWVGRLDEATSRLRRLADDPGVPTAVARACDDALLLLGGAAAGVLPGAELADHLTI